MLNRFRGDEGKDCGYESMESTAPCLNEPTNKVLLPIFFSGIIRSLGNLSLETQYTGRTAAYVRVAAYGTVKCRGLFPTTMYFCAAI